LQMAAVVYDDRGRHNAFLDFPLSGDSPLPAPTFPEQW
jgi:hypothetical protein